MSKQSEGVKRCFQFCLFNFFRNHSLLWFDWKVEVVHCYFVVPNWFPSNCLLNSFSKKLGEQILTCQCFFFFTKNFCLIIEMFYLCTFGTHLVCFSTIYGYSVRKVAVLVIFWSMSANSFIMHYFGVCCFQQTLKCTMAMGGFS